MTNTAEFQKTESGMHPNPLFSYTLPAEYYYDPSIFEREKEEIWFKTWQLAGYEHELAEPGDYITHDILGQKVFVTRGKDGQLHGFFNVCMHRGHVLVEGRGNKNIFTCPFHAWSYDSTGALKAAGNAENVAGFQLEDFSLSEVRVEQFLHMIFVNLDPDAAPLESMYGDLGQDIRENLPKYDQLKLGRSDPYNIDANWKFIPEQNECYHCPSLHPQAMGTDQAYMDPSWETAEHDYWTNHVIRTKRDVTADQMPYEFRDDDDLKDVQIWFMWPNLIFLAHHGASNFKVTRIMPTGPEKSFQLIDNFCVNDPLSSWDIECMNNYRDSILPQDVPAMEKQQLGVKCRGYKQGRLMCDADLTWRTEHGTHFVDHMTWKALNGDNY